MYFKFVVSLRTDIKNMLSSAWFTVKLVILLFDGDRMVEVCVFDVTLVSSDTTCGIKGGGGGEGMDDKEEE